MTSVRKATAFCGPLALAILVQCLPASHADAHHATLDAGGQRVANGNLAINGSLGGIGGWASVGESDGFVKAGYAGQIYDVASFAVHATPSLVQQGGSSQLSGAAVLDDATVLRLTGHEILWHPANPPLSSITASGLATSSNPTSTNEVSFSGSFLGVQSPAAILLINRPPVALSDAAGRVPNRSLKILVQKLTANDADADGDVLNLTLPSATTANGANVRITGAWVIYQAPAGFNGADSFDYNISDGRGGSSGGSVAIVIQADSGEITLNLLELEVLPETGFRRIRFVGIPARSYSIQATDSLNPPAWTALGSAIAGPNGIYDFTDMDTANHPIRFYRSLSE